VPKFFWQEVRNNSEAKNVKFRNPNKPNDVMQDGYKRKFLCDSCEQKLSKYERAFSLKYIERGGDKIFQLSDEEFFCPWIFHSINVLARFAGFARTLVQWFIT
jgi:hypothetical protein